MFNKHSIGQQVTKAILWTSCRFKCNKPNAYKLLFRACIISMDL